MTTTRTIRIITISNTTTIEDASCGTAATPFLHNLVGVDFDVSSKLEVSRFEIVDADTRARFAYCLSS